MKDIIEQDPNAFFDGLGALRTAGAVIDIVCGDGTTVRRGRRTVAPRLLLRLVWGEEAGVGPRQRLVTGAVTTHSCGAVERVEFKRGGDHLLLEEVA